MTRPLKLASVNDYLAGVESAADRLKVRSLCRKAFAGAGLPRPRWLSQMNRTRRELLAASIFEVENELESRSGGWHHPCNQRRIDQLNAARNLVLDDLGWNEPPAGGDQ
jgi:hypothetical protein